MSYFVFVMEHRHGRKAGPTRNPDRRHQVQGYDTARKWVVGGSHRLRRWLDGDDGTPRHVPSLGNKHGGQDR